MKFPPMLHAYHSESHTSTCTASDFKMAVLPSLVNFFVMVFGNTMDTHKTILDQLTISPKLREVFLVKDSHYIIAFVPIVSRAGTDISSAMEKIPQDKPVILIVLHHTFNPNFIAPDSRLCVNQDRVFAVDCLYHEDKGLLRCLTNDDAIKAVKEHLRCEEHHIMDNSCIICIVVKKTIKSNSLAAVVMVIILLIIVCIGLIFGVNTVVGITVFCVLVVAGGAFAVIYLRRGVRNNSLSYDSNI